MAQEIQVLTWCDGLKQGNPGDFVVRHSPRVEGITRTFAVDGRPPKNVDLCDPCNDEMTLAELRACLKESGVSVEAGKGLPVERRPARGGGAATVARSAMGGIRNGRPPQGARQALCLWCPLDYTKSGWLGHIQKHHGFTGIKDALGHQCPVCGQDGFDMVSVHITRHHAEFATSATAAFIWARDNGDPYGVYAARRAAGQNIVEALA
jgi:hypothetical protein